MTTKDDSFAFETADGTPLPTDPPPASTGHPGEKLEQPIPADPIPTADPVAAAARAAEKRSIANWAKAKGMLPEFKEGKKLPTARPKAKPPLVHNPAFAPFHAARSAKGWPVNMEVTEAEFDRAIAESDGPPVEGVTPHIYR